MDGGPAGVWRRAGTAGATLALLALASGAAWVSARPSTLEAGDVTPAAAPASSAEAAPAPSTTSATTTTVETDPPSPGDLDPRWFDGTRPERIRLVYDLQRNDGSRTEVVYSRDGSRWSVRDDRYWFVHVDGTSVRCMLRVACQESTKPEPPWFGLGDLLYLPTPTSEGERRRIAGIPARCWTGDVIAWTVCHAEEDGLLLLSDPGPDAMKPSAFESARTELVRVEEPRESDFASPSA